MTPDHDRLTPSPTRRRIGGSTAARGVGRTIGAVAFAIAVAACSSGEEGASTTTLDTASPTTVPDGSTSTTPPTTVPATTTVPDGSTTTLPAATTSTTSTTPPTTVPAPVFPDALPIIVDSDANNELDDQHALAYTLFRPDLFDLVAITTNATSNGGRVIAHTAEAERIVALAEREGTVPVASGADGTFDEIRPRLADLEHDGRAAVDTIIAAARAEPDLVIVPIGKLTNVALALAKAPDIADGLRVVWLGANYPLGGGEYNLDNDPSAVAYVLNEAVDAGLEFEIAVVRPGEPTGTAAVQVTIDEAADRLPGLGPVIDPPVVGRTGSTFTRFGDYAAALFQGAEGFGDPPARSLFDLAAVAVVGEPSWADRVETPAPAFVDGEFVERPGRGPTIVYWENFDRDAIIDDLYATLAAAG